MKNFSSLKGLNKMHKHHDTNVFEFKGLKNSWQGYTLIPTVD